MLPENKFLILLTSLVLASLVFMFVANAQYTIIPPPGTTIINPNIDAQGHLQFTTSQGSIGLAVSNYVFWSGALAIDGSFGCQNSNPPGQGQGQGPGPIGLFPTNSSAGQTWSWDGTFLQNQGISLGKTFCGSAPAVPGAFLADHNGTPYLLSAGDTMKIAGGGTSQFTIQDVATNRYLDGTGNVLKFTTTPFVWGAK